MCYCHTSYITDWIKFESGKYYQHLGAREMKSGEKIMGFGKLENWTKYFLEPVEDRQRKLKELI
jgi:hypothetical protein